MLNELTSTVWRLSQAMNIPLISVTLDVLNVLRLSEVSEEHITNISLMSVTLAVLRFSRPSMLIIFDRF